MMQPLEQSILNSWPKTNWTRTRLLVAVSGGADSVALLRGLLNLTDQPQLLHVAHFNHQWRGHESDEDEQFVRDLCSDLSVHLTSAEPPKRAAKQFLLPQTPMQRPTVRTFAVKALAVKTFAVNRLARQLRYDFLSQTAYALGARYVVTAHTASDRVETMIHHLCRGTGLSGVAVPSLFRDLDEDLVLVRPLLLITRDQVIEYLESIGQKYRSDSSNSDEAFKRNFIRHRVLPLLREAYGDSVDRHLLSYSHLAEEASGALRFYGLQWIESNIDQSAQPNEVLFPASAVVNVPWPVVQAALEICWKRQNWPLQSMTREHWWQIRQHATATSTNPSWVNQCNLPGNLHLARNFTHIRIRSQSARK